MLGSDACFGGAAEARPSRYREGGCERAAFPSCSRNYQGMRIKETSRNEDQGLSKTCDLRPQALLTRDRSRWQRDVAPPVPAPTTRAALELGLWTCCVQPVFHEPVPKDGRDPLGSLDPQQRSHLVTLAQKTRERSDSLHPSQSGRSTSRRQRQLLKTRILHNAEHLVYTAVPHDVAPRLVYTAVPQTFLGADKADGTTTLQSCDDEAACSVTGQKERTSCTRVLFPFSPGWLGLLPPRAPRTSCSAWTVRALVRTRQQAGRFGRHSLSSPYFQSWARKEALHS